MPSLANSVARTFASQFLALPAKVAKPLSLERERERQRQRQRLGSRLGFSCVSHSVTGHCKVRIDNFISFQLLVALSSDGLCSDRRSNCDNI